MDRCDDAVTAQDTVVKVAVEAGAAVTHGTVLAEIKD